MRKRVITRLSDSNLEIMKFVWSKGEVTINEALNAINVSRKKKLKRATVQVQMRRLEKYGWLKHRKLNREFYYSALRGQEESKVDILSRVRNRVFGGSHSELVKCLFSNSNVPPEELKRIIEFLKQKEKE